MLSLALLRQSIEAEVFVPQGRERFMPESASWIMDFRRAFMRAEVLDAYAELFYERFERDWPFQVGGAEVAAIPLVTAIALKMREKGKPVNAFFVRKSRKKTGLLKMVEGKVTRDKVILVDDLINRGQTFERQILVAEEAGVSVHAVFVALRFRPLEYYKRLLEKNIRVESVFTLDDFHESLGTSLKDLDEKKPLPVVFETFWRFQVPDPKLEWVQPKSGVALDESRVYFGTDRGVLYALNQSDGSVAWTYQVGLKAKGPEIFSTPVVHGGQVYFGAYDGNVYCLDAETGKRQWVSFEADWVRGGLLLLPEKNQLIVPCMFGLWHRAGGVVALDPRNGKKLWERTLSCQVTSMPVCSVKHDTLFVGSADGTVYCLNRDDGQIGWSFKTLGAVNEAVALSPDQSSLIAASMDGAVYCLSTIDGSLRWKFENGLANYAAPLIHDNRVLVASLDKNLYCLDLATGEQRWSRTLRARIFASPRIFDDRLYLGCNDARLSEIDPRTGKETGSFQVTERITNPLCADARRERFYLVTYANEVYCLKRKQLPRGEPVVGDN